MNRTPQQVREEFDRDLAGASSADDLEVLRVRYVGRKAGVVREILQSLGSLPPEERSAAGKSANELRAHVEGALQAAREAFGGGRKRAAAQLDPTLPGRRLGQGLPHPIARISTRIEEIFLEMGYSVEDGPEVETDFHNFEALNIPAHHPARAEADTFYISESVLLRTHTSPVQIRTMQSRQPPLKIIAPGKAFRRDTPDQSHSPMFHQVEGLVVAEGISLAHLKGTLSYFCRRMFGPQVNIRIRPSYFPFVEPGAEYDVSCILCKGNGCGACKRTGWLEMGGCGMVHPAVFEKLGYDPERWTGYAFGLGIDRITMLVYGVHDIRLFFENDLRFLSQFRD